MCFVISISSSWCLVGFLLVPFGVQSVLVSFLYLVLSISCGSQLCLHVCLPYVFPVLPPCPTLHLDSVQLHFQVCPLCPNIFLCTYWLSPFVLCHILPHVVRSLCQSALADWHICFCFCFLCLFNSEKIDVILSLIVCWLLHLGLLSPPQQSTTLT